MTVTLCLIHGAFCRGWPFADFRRHFEARGFEVMAPVLRHHDTEPGAPVPPELGRTSLLDYAQDLEAALRNVEGPLVLIGHSMGGLLCQMLAARGLGYAAVLLAPSAPWGVLFSTHFEVSSAIGFGFHAGPYWDRPVVPSAAIAVEHALDRLDGEKRREAIDQLTPESGRAVFEVLHWPLDLRRASQVDAAKVRIPLLCITGEHDRINPPSTVRSIARRYRGHGVSTVFAGRSHWLAGEPGWREIADHIEAWLKDKGIPV